MDSDLKRFMFTKYGQKQAESNLRTTRKFLMLMIKYIRENEPHASHSIEQITDVLLDIPTTFTRLRG